MSAVLYSANKDKIAIELVENLIGKSKTDNGYLNMIRYFQYTSTTAKNNPYSYVLSSNGANALTKSGIKNSDKGKFIDAVKNRSGARLLQLWKENKKEIFNAFSKENYDATISSYVDSLIEFHDSADYAKKIKALKKASPKADAGTLGKAGKVAEWKSYKELAFWFRRTMEKNDTAVYQMLKEIQSNYK